MIEEDFNADELDFDDENIMTYFQMTFFWVQEFASHYRGKNIEKSNNVSVYSLGNANEPMLQLKNQSESSFMEDMVDFILISVECQNREFIKVDYLPEHKMVAETQIKQDSVSDSVSEKDQERVLFCRTLFFFHS